MIVWCWPAGMETCGWRCLMDCFQPSSVLFRLLEFRFCACERTRRVRRVVVRVVDGSSALSTAVTAVTHSATCLYHSLVTMTCGARPWVNSSCLYYYLGGRLNDDVVYSLVLVHCCHDGLSACILVSVYLFWALVHWGCAENRFNICCKLTTRLLRKW